MKFHWGHGIAIFFILFIGFILTMIFLSTRKDVDLVTDNYYEKELVYQEQIDKMQNAASLSEPMKVALNWPDLTIQYPAEQLALGVSGTVLFFRPSDPKLDKTYEVNPDEAGTQQIDMAKMAKGLYKVKIEWQAGGVAFYNEETIHIP
jgi:hypothetical protein